MTHALARWSRAEERLNALVARIENIAAQTDAEIITPREAAERLTRAAKEAQQET